MSGVPALNPDSWQRVHQHLHPHDHAVAMYADREGLQAALRRFLVDGVAANDLMVFVHSFGADQEAWDLLEAAHGGSRDLRSAQIVVVSLYKHAFQGENPVIDYEHVGRVVDGLVRQTEASSRRALRIFVDASRAYLQEGRLQEWFAFEAWLGRRLQARVGLVCAYRREDVLRPDVFPQALETHAYRFGA